MASKVLSSEGLETVIGEAEKAQQELGDCLPENAVSQLPEMRNFELEQNNLTNLRQIWEGWSASRRHQFNQKYGHIGYLIFVTIETHMLRAMIQFSDPPYRIFTFNTIDMTPTIEEYAVLLNMTSSATDKVYRYESKQKFKRSLAKIMGIHINDLTSRVKEKGKSQCVSGDFLLDFIQKHPEDDKGMSVMALAIYGLIIFPKVLGHIEGKVINFFEQVEHGVNPVPGIVAKTFRYLNYCRNKGEGRFIGCAQLLHIWMKSHFECYDPKFIDLYRSDKLPIMEFCLSKWPSAQHKHVWIETFRCLNSEGVIWMAPWMLWEYVLYRCGYFNWVPLLGLWGGISYAPTMVRRQLGSKQFIPVTQGLNQLEFSYGDEGTAKLVKEITKSWGQTRRVRPGRYTNAETVGYSTWHDKQGKGFLAPQVYGHDLPIQRTDEPEDYRTEIKARYENATHELRTDNTTLALKNQELQAEMNEWKDQTEKARKRARQLHRYINSIIIRKGELKKENVELQDTAKNLTSTVRSLYKKVEALQTELGTKTIECDEAVVKNRDLQSSVRDLNYQIDMQHNRIRGLGRECKGLRRECQNLDSLQNGCALLYSQAEHISAELTKFAVKALEMAEQAGELRQRIIPDHSYGQELIFFLDDVHKKLLRVGMFI